MAERLVVAQGNPTGKSPKSCPAPREKIIRFSVW
jgi:hypothetical protein